MRYIVVYTILILGVTTLKTSAQKPAIDLLPSASASVHPEALIDTCITPDSLFLMDSIILTPFKKQSEISGSTYTGELFPALRKRTDKALALLKPGLDPLFIKNLNPFIFIIRFTALKF
jgi:hypothetical protein